MRETILAKCPTMRAVKYLEKVGVKIYEVNGMQIGGQEDTHLAGTDVRAVAARRLIFDAVYVGNEMDPLREAALLEMEDFVDDDDRTLLESGQMKARHAAAWRIPGVPNAFGALVRGLVAGGWYDGVTETCGGDD